MSATLRIKTEKGFGSSCKPSKVAAKAPVVRVKKEPGARASNASAARITFKTDAKSSASIKGVKIKAEPGTRSSTSITSAGRVANLTLKGGQCGPVHISVQVKVEGVSRTRSTSKKSTTTKRKTTKKRRTRRKKRRRTTTSTRRTTSSTSRGSSKSVRNPLVTPRDRIASTLGISAATARSLPSIRKPQAEDLNKRKLAAGIQPLSILGEGLDPNVPVSHDESSSRRQPSSSVSTGNIARTDLLDNILEGQSTLLKRSSNSLLDRDGRIKRQRVRTSGQPGHVQTDLSRNVRAAVQSAISANRQQRPALRSSNHSDSRLRTPDRREPKKEPGIKKEPGVKKEPEADISDAETISPVGSPVRQNIKEEFSRDHHGHSSQTVTRVGHAASLACPVFPNFRSSPPPARAFGNHAANSSSSAASFSWHIPQVSYPTRGTSMETAKHEPVDRKPPKSVLRHIDARIKQEQRPEFVDLTQIAVKEEPIDDEVVFLD